MPYSWPLHYKLCGPPQEGRGGSYPGRVEDLSPKLRLSSAPTGDKCPVSGETVDSGRLIWVETDSGLLRLEKEESPRLGVPGVWLPGCIRA